MNPITNSCRILIAMNDIAVRHASSCILARAGFAITEAQGAADVLRKIEKGLPDLVLLDVAMPGVDGQELCAQIRQQPQAGNLPVFFLFAGRMDDYAKARGLNNGADGYLNWPESRDMLVASIKSVLRLRQTAARLRESEERFRTTFDQVPVGLGYLTLDGEWTGVNRRLCQILGYTQEELLHKSCQDAACPEDLPTLLEHQRRVLAGEAESFALEQRCRRKDGSVFWASWMVSLARNSSGEAEQLVVVVDDISVRKWTEENLLLIRAGIEGSSEAVAITDHEGRLSYHNRAFAQMFGYRAEELTEPLAQVALYADQAVGRAVFDAITHGRASLPLN
jgi:PAS domain S-box-containing protein